jgi:DNA-binding protein YbaB
VIGSLRESTVSAGRTDLAEVRGAADSADGLVYAEVDGHGRLTDLWLDPRAFRDTDSHALAASIIDTVWAAAREVAADAYER